MTADNVAERVGSALRAWKHAPRWGELIDGIESLIRDGQLTNASVTNGARNIKHRILIGDRQDGHGILAYFFLAEAGDVWLYERNPGTQRTEAAKATAVERFGAHRFGPWNQAAALDMLERLIGADLGS